VKRRTHRKKGPARWLANLQSGRLGAFLARNRPVIKSLAVFVGIILAFVFALPVYRGFINGPFPVAVANSTGFLLRVLGVDARTSGTSIISSIFSVEVIPACTGMFAYVFFFAAVVAYPCRLRDKLIGTSLGFPAIFIINLVRMVSLFYIGAYLPQFFEAAHLLFWQSLMIASAVLIWLFWARRASYASK
jgi:exosortase H (IPTLxxWG-CTERM-specific)